jgi:S1-C subfamily serine protease
VAVPTVAAHAAPALPNPAVAVYQQNGASVVNITSLAVVPTPQGQTVQPQGVGSGFILDTDGRIVTNKHVVQDADQLAVTFQDKTTVPARLVAVHEAVAYEERRSLIGSIRFGSRHDWNAAATPIRPHDSLRPSRILPPANKLLTCI